MPPLDDMLPHTNTNFVVYEYAKPKKREKPQKCLPHCLKAPLTL